MEIFERTFEVKDRPEVIEVRVTYDKGRSLSRRGYYLHVQPIEITKCDGYTMTAYTLFKGETSLLEGVTRQSKGADQRNLETAEINAFDWASEYAKSQGWELV